MRQTGWAKISKQTLAEKIFLSEMPNNLPDNSWTGKVSEYLTVLDDMSHITKCTKERKQQLASEHPEHMTSLLEKSIKQHIPDSEVCQILEELSSFIKANPARGQQLLRIAIESGNPFIAKKLLTIGVSPNEVHEIPGMISNTKFQGTALFLAVLSKNAAMISVLLENGANIDKSVVDLVSSILHHEESVWGHQAPPRIEPHVMQIFRLLEAHANSEFRENCRNNASNSLNHNCKPNQTTIAGMNSIAWSMKGGSLRRNILLKA